MPTARKEAAIAELTEKLAAAKSLFLTDYTGLTVDEITRLRGELRKDGNTYSVVKNTLLRIAAGDLAARLEDVLAGPTGIVFAGADPVAPAKALKTFSDTVKRVAVKAAYIDGQIVGALQVDQLAKLPPTSRADRYARRHARESNPWAHHGALGKPQRPGARARAHSRAKSRRNFKRLIRITTYDGTHRSHRTNR